ncbi:MAG: response regulator [Magnetospirillum sp.]|nr:response regulator [Magnetospirillum sp.]
MHRVLLRQLRRTFDLDGEGGAAALLDALAGLDSAGLPEPVARVVAGLPEFLRRVEETYAQNDRDLDLRNRSLEISSEELTRANSKLRDEAASQARVIASLRETANEILAAINQPLVAEDGSGLESLSKLMGALVRERGAAQSELERQKFALDQHAIVSITDTAGTILYANEKFCRISGYSAAELVGSNHRIVRSNAHSQQFFESMWRTITAGNVWHGEVCNRRKDGGLYWVAATIVPILDEAALPRQYIAIRTDITERKAMEAALISAADRAEAANRAKSEFLATMSHEIRTPMNGIIGMTSLLLDTRMDSEQRHFATTVRTSAESLLTIINDILDFSKMEAGRIEFEESPFEVRPLIEGVVDILAPRLKGRDIELSYFVPPETRGIFRGDAGRLRQVLMNLAGNAVKFTETGSVSLGVALDPIDARTARLSIRVKDTGIGIADEAKPRMFSMFSQADSSTARRFGGSGLGLAISKRIIDAMGGTIGFDSTIGEGSTFWFSVPIQCTDLQPAEDPIDNPLEGLKLLIVDDNPTNREVFLRQLGGWGAAAAAVDSAAAGLMAIRDAAARGTPFAAVLLDHHMPGMSGLDLAAVLRADSSLAALKLILASSAQVGEIKDKAMALGFDAVFAKPIRQSTLLDTLLLHAGRPLSRQAYADPAPDDRIDASKSLRILVAEDNSINQQVAVGLLTKLGHRADVADDGGEALALIERGDYDLVLMDVQMPRMDGLSATRAIRALPTAKARLPVVAMTANAMAGDREACLAAGMDDYIAKPIDRHRLAALLDRWTERCTAERPDRVRCHPAGMVGFASDVVPSPPEEPLVDREIQHDLADALGSQAFHHLLVSFGDGMPGRLRDIRAALNKNDPVALVAAAHALRGAASNLGFNRLATAVLRLEHAAKDRRLDLDGLADEVDTVARLTTEHMTAT